MDLKTLFSRLRRGSAEVPDTVQLEPRHAESGFFSTQFLERPEDAQAQAVWAVRASALGARPLDRRKAEQIFFDLWGTERYVAALSREEFTRLTDYLHFVTVPGQREVISQDEQGDYLGIVLEGALAVDRVQAWGGRARLAEARPGDVVGEMSLLDTGSRFSTCTTLTACSLAIVDAVQLDAMIRAEPRLGVALLACLSRRLSLRLRQVSARLSAVLTGN